MLVETLTGLDAIKINNAQSERQYQWEHLTGQLSKLELRVKSLSYVAVNFTSTAATGQRRGNYCRRGICHHRRQSQHGG